MLFRRTAATQSAPSAQWLLAAATNAMIHLQGVRKVYLTGAVEYVALKAIQLQIQPGEFVAIVGKSGSGKSTLLNMMTGIDRPTAGEVLINGAPLHRMSEDQLARWRGKNLGIVFQFFQLLPTLTLLENVLLPMDFSAKFQAKTATAYAMHLLEMVDLADAAHKLPSAISGGQQQRVAIARALANDPPLLIADEPTGNLDSKTAETVFQLFEKLVQADKTIVMVTHDHDLAQRAARTIIIADGQLVPSRAENKPLTDVAVSAMPKPFS